MALRGVYKITGIVDNPVHCIHPLFLDPILFAYLVQMLVDEGDQRLLDDHQLVRGVVEQRVEGVPLAAHAHVVVAAGQLLGDDAVGEDALALGDDHHVHHHVLVSNLNRATL